MIHLSTGLPGAGKTLYTIDYVNRLAKAEHRPVFYSGIKDLALDWHEIEAEKWMDCPEGAIIVIDECQRIFRPAGAGAKVPEYISGLETHRHKGHDIFLVTQHPMLMNANVRRLTERHWHISRRFGMHRTTIFQFESCKDQPLANTQNAQRLEWKYPKEVFSYYKSAEVHTVKRRLPYQYLVMFLVPVAVIGAIWYFVQRHYQNGQIVIPGAQPVPATTTTGTAIASNAPGRTEEKKPMTTAEYVKAYEPRIHGLAYTAPVYDKVTEPQEAPVPAACINSKSKGCKCYSQQGTKLVMEQNLCIQIVENGFFQAFPIRAGVKEGWGAEKPVQAQQVASREPSVGIIPSVKPQSLSDSSPLKK